MPFRITERNQRHDGLLTGNLRVHNNVLNIPSARAPAYLGQIGGHKAAFSVHGMAEDAKGVEQVEVRI